MSLFLFSRSSGDERKTLLLNSDCQVDSHPTKTGKRSRGWSSGYGSNESRHDANNVSWCDITEGIDEDSGETIESLESEVYQVETGEVRNSTTSTKSDEAEIPVTELDKTNLGDVEEQLRRELDALFEQEFSESDESPLISTQEYVRNETGYVQISEPFAVPSHFNQRPNNQKPDPKKSVANSEGSYVQIGNVMEQTSQYNADGSYPNVGEDMSMDMGTSNQKPDPKKSVANSEGSYVQIGNVMEQTSQYNADGSYPNVGEDMSMDMGTSNGCLPMSDERNYVLMKDLLPIPPDSADQPQMNENDLESMSSSGPMASAYVKLNDVIFLPPTQHISSHHPEDSGADFFK